MDIMALEDSIHGGHSPVVFPCLVNHEERHREPCEGWDGDTNCSNYRGAYSWWNAGCDGKVESDDHAFRTSGFHIHFSNAGNGSKGESA